MITYTHGNLLEADVEALVNTVNTVGIMGKGIALLFKRKFPQNFQAYARACARNEVMIGKMFVTENVPLRPALHPNWIINFPTKTHWRTQTRIRWVEEGLDDLVRTIQAKGIRSIAIPALGCGNGGLTWSEVRRCIEDRLGGLDPRLDVMIFEPPPPDSLPHNEPMPDVEEAIRSGWHATARPDPDLPLFVDRDVS